MPRVDGLASQILPAPSLPIAEVQFLEAIIDNRLGGQPGGEIASAPCGACEDARGGRQFGEPLDCFRERFGLALKIEAAIANPFFAQRFGMTDKDQTHADAATRNAIS